MDVCMVQTVNDECNVYSFSLDVGRAGSIVSH